MPKPVKIPFCYRCRAKPAVACVRAAIGCKDAVCVACCAPGDVMLPLYWPGMEFPFPPKEVV